MLISRGVALLHPVRLTETRLTVIYELSALTEDALCVSFRLISLQ